MSKIYSDQDLGRLIMPLVIEQLLINYAMLGVISSVLIAGRGFFVACYQLTGLSSRLYHF